MTKGDREYLVKIAIEAAEKADMVLHGKEHADIFETVGEREAFSQGIWYVNQILESFLGISARKINRIEE